MPKTKYFRKWQLEVWANKVFNDCMKRTGDKNACKIELDSLIALVGVEGGHGGRKAVVNTYKFKKKPFWKKSNQKLKKIKIKSEKVRLV